METLSAIQAATLAIAVLGAVLGVINTWHNLDKARVKLRVRPAHAVPLGETDPNLTFCVEVRNLSAFAVTISEVGVLFRGTMDRGAVLQPVTPDGGQWPRRLEPRTSVTVYSHSPTSRNGHKLKCAYAKTQCGYTKTGTTPAFRQIARGN
jgi:hypothetical protein